MFDSLLLPLGGTSRGWGEPLPLQYNTTHETRYSSTHSASVFLHSNRLSGPSSSLAVTSDQRCSVRALTRSPPHEPHKSASAEETGKTKTKVGDASLLKIKNKKEDALARKDTQQAPAECEGRARTDVTDAP